jgi:hypothetical protein
MVSNLTTVKDLINAAFTYSGTLGESEELSGDRFQFGLCLLNQLITNANMQVFLPFAQAMKDLPKGYQVYVLSDSPDIVSNQEAIPETVSGWGPTTIVQAPQPKIINSMGYRVGLRFTTLTRTGTPDMLKFVMPVSSTPAYYSYEEYPSYTAIILDRPSMFPLRVVYSKNIEMANMNEKLAVPLQYTEYLMYGIAYRLAVKYQQPTESIAGLKMLADEAKAHIKDLVKNDHMITWNDIETNDGFGNFGAVLCPPNW